MKNVVTYYLFLVVNIYVQTNNTVVKLSWSLPCTQYINIIVVVLVTL